MPRLKKTKVISDVKVGGVRKRSRLPVWSKLLLILIVAVGGVYALTRAFADSSSLYLSPSSTTIQSGSNFTVAVRLNPVSNVDGVMATISYDPTVLQFVSVDTTTSAFPVSLEATGGSGKVDIQRGAFAPNTISTDSLVANVTFTALKSASSTPLTLTGNSTYQGAYLNPGVASGSVAVTSPAPPPPPADVTPPTVTITSPPNSSKIGTKVTISASAKDNSGTVSKMEVYIDGGIVQTATGVSSTSYNWNLKGKKTAHGNHTITVKAYDPSGNVGSASVTVTS